MTTTTAPRRFPSPRSVLTATAVAATFSGVPSTVHALLTGRDPLAAARAAGTVLQPHRRPGSLVAGAVAHGIISLGWTTVLAAAPPGRRAWWGGGGALAVAALDLGLIGRQFPAIRALPLAPQVADHVAFGLLAGWVLDHGEDRVRSRVADRGETTRGAPAAPGAVGDDAGPAGG